MVQFRIYVCLRFFVLNSNSLNSFLCRADSQREPKEEEESGSSTPSGTKHKIVVLGGAKVGKSSIISQFLYGNFTTKYKRTVEEMHREEFNVNGVRLTLEILDTAGSLEFPAMRALSISSGDAFILVYSVIDPKSFEEARIIRDQILEIKGSAAVPIVVVGNKIDLMDEHNETVSSSFNSCIFTLICLFRKIKYLFIKLYNKTNKISYILIV